MKKINNLFELRAAAAILIVISHIPITAKLIGPSLGGFGVAIFFMLSAFLLCYSTEKSCISFIKKRIIRILPLYYFMTIFTFILVCVKPTFFLTTTPSFSNFIKSLLFIPYVNLNGLVRPILDVGWALFPEVWLYILYAILIKYFYNYRNIIASFVLIVIFITGELFFIKSPIYLQFKMACPAFLLGIVLYYIWYMLNLNNRTYNFVYSSYLYSAICYVIFFISSIIYDIAITKNVGIYSLFLPFFVFLIFLLFEGKNKKSPFMIQISAASYSLYLTHEFVVKGFSRLIYNMEVISLISLLLTVILVIIAITLAFMVEKYINKPLSKKIETLIDQSGRK